MPTVQDLITTAPPANLPERTVIYGREGIGKTSLAAMYPKPLFMMAGNETGIQTLKKYKRVPEDVATLPPIEDYKQYLWCVEQLRAAKLDYKHLVIDGIGELDKIFRKEVIEKYYDNTESSYQAYNRGNDTLQNFWSNELRRLQVLQKDTGVNIVLIGHMVNQTHQNPVGADYDGVNLSAQKKSADIICEWADNVFALVYRSDRDGQLDPDNQKGKKKIKESWRVLIPEGNIAVKAKNRMGLTTEIPMGDSAEEAYSNLRAAIDAAERGETATFEKENDFNG